MRRIVKVYILLITIVLSTAALLLLPEVRKGGGKISGTALAQPTLKVPVPVVTAVVTREPFAETLEALGTAKANESVVITPTVEERVVGISFDDGDVVQKGQVLVKLDDSEARHLLAEARAGLKEQQLQYERVRSLAKTNAASRSQLDQAESLLGIARARADHLEARLSNYTIRAPFSGVLGLRQISLGAVVDSDTVITTLDDTATIKLDFTVPETYLGALKTATEISAVSSAYPGRRFDGTVTVLSSRVDPDTRTLTVRAGIPNPDRLLKPGMLLTVTLVKNRSESVIVPEEAVIMEKNKKFALVVTAEKTVQKKEIVTGRRSPGKVEVTSGLSPGQQVIIEGITRVRPGGVVNVVETRNAGQL